MGAKGEGRPLTERDRWLCGPGRADVLRAKGVMFAGLDVIGDYLTEINVTSPTGIRELDRQFGIDIAAKLIAAIGAEAERDRGGRRRPPLTRRPTHGSIYSGSRSMPMELRRGLGSRRARAINDRLGSTLFSPRSFTAS